MRIAIVNITGGGISGGYLKYLRNVIPRIRDNSIVESMLIASSFSLKKFNLFSNSKNFRSITCKPHKFFGLKKDKDLIKQLEEFNPNVIFVPTERFFKYDKAPIVNMIQNMEPFSKNNLIKNPISENIKNFIKAIDGRKGIENSKHIIAISEFVRDYLISNCKISPNQIGLVYHGVDYFDNQKAIRPFNLPKNTQFLFTAGSIRPARGLEDLFQALDYLSRKNLNIPHLVIAGDSSKNMTSYKDKLKDFGKLKEIEEKIHWIGNINDYEMAWCYKNCKAFIMTSRVEACPFIALEALSNRCVVISSDSRPMPEIFGDVAMYYPTGKGLELAKLIFSLETGKNMPVLEKKRELIEKQLKKFSWDICATKTLNQLQKATNL